MRIALILLALLSLSSCMTNTYSPWGNDDNGNEIGSRFHYHPKH